ncbi:MAG: hypothetical protein LBR56_06640 [Sporomusaceae bacterium]|jgi:hypothetical protein|nr:hypothetical protein [Sporomusaceae bacterium]
MHDDFWRGLLVGSIITIVGGTLVRQQRKPLLEQGKDALSDTAHDLVKQARRARHRFADRLS